MIDKIDIKGLYNSENYFGIIQIFAEYRPISIARALKPSLWILDDDYSCNAFSKIQ
jgi:hypothetical protein